MDNLKHIKENTITRGERYVPKLLLTVYKEEKSDKIYVEQTILGENGQHHASEPLSVAVANDLGSNLHTMAIKHLEGWIPPQLLHIAYDGLRPDIIWWTHTQKVKMYYIEELHITDGEMCVPALLWKWSCANDSLHLFALYDDSKPSHDTQLYYAPFHNISTSCQVCIGTGRKHLKEYKTFDELIREVMKIFWKTKFSELHNEQAVKCNINSLHNDLIKTGDPFPVDQLVADEQTLKDLL